MVKVLNSYVDVDGCTTADDVEAAVEKALNEAGYYVVQNSAEAESFFATYIGAGAYVHDNVCEETRITIADQYGEFTVGVRITEFYADSGSVDYCYLIEAKEL